MYKNVLVPLDGSELAELALEEALKLIDTSNQDSKITLLRVNEIYPITYQDQEIETENMSLKSQEYLDKVKERLENKVKVETVIKNGRNPAVEICQYADEQDIEIVVIASHGIGGLLQWALGSHADKVIRHCSKPVLIKSCRECEL